LALLLRLELKLSPLQTEDTPFESCLNRRDSGNVAEVLRIPSSKTRDETLASASPAFAWLFLFRGARK